MIKLQFMIYLLTCNSVVFSTPPTQTLNVVYILLRLDFESLLVLQHWEASEQVPKHISISDISSLAVLV